MIYFPYKHTRISGAMLKRIAILLILIIFLNCLFTFPVFAQPTLEQNQSPVSYVPKQPNPKDEQNIDFLYEISKATLHSSNVPPEGIPAEVLTSRKNFSEYYYSSEKDSFALREFMKLIRAATCKVSRISGVRGIDLVSKFVEFDKQKSLADYDLGLNFWKSAYEHFCPNLW